MATKTDILKAKLLKALEKSLGIVTTACKNVGCNRSTYYDYYSDDPKFKAAVDELQNMTLDFVESQLHKQIKEDNTTATIFYLKTKGKKRGYIERQEVDHTTLGESMNNNVDVSKLKTDTIKDLLKNGFKEPKD